MMIFHSELFNYNKDPDGKSLGNMVIFLQRIVETPDDSHGL
jgi:hypothetical protein